MEEEGVPSTALREVSLLQMLNESNHVVKYDAVFAREQNAALGMSTDYISLL